MNSAALVEELRVHQVELELQNNELRSVERDLELQNSQLRSVEHELELSRAQYRELFDLAPVGYVSLDSRGVIGRANRAAGELLGAAHGDLIRKSLAEFTEGSDLRMLRAHLYAAARNHHARELGLRRLDGRLVHVLMESQPAPGGGCLTVLTDISERRRTEEALCRSNEELEARVRGRTRLLASRNEALEEALRARAASEAERGELAVRLRDAERLESLGLLAGGVAHDFNNILVGVLANADLLLESVPDLPDAVRDGLVTIKRAARSAADLTRQLLVYAGRERVALQPVRLDRLVQESLQLLQAGLRDRVELRAELAADERWIDADAAQVQQVVGNLVTNALEALGDAGGSVVVRTRVEELDAQALAGFLQKSCVEPGHFALLEVEDTGMGIDSEQLSRIFEPFFSSKFTGRGLGLASVRGIVRSHHAALRVRSDLGRGSSFEIAWPLAARRSRSTIPPRLEATAWRGSGQVLLVDDDPMVLHALTRQLAQLGFTVTQAGSGAAALELFRANPSRFRLAVVDRTMPGLSGDRLIELLHELEPALPVVLVSGYSAGGAVVDSDHVAFVAKPMTLCDLQQVAARLLEPRPTGIDSDPVKYGDPVK
jgi:two-component system cell cycle sensor histidine kinase/response regulator CckA